MGCERSHMGMRSRSHSLSFCLTFVLLPHPLSSHPRDSYLVDEKSNRIAPGRNKNATHDIAAVYHYVTKSRMVGSGENCWGRGRECAREF
jgi:hypothetical protein